ncbi:phage tail length tape measure family protein [Jiella avicenniae]|uniref:Phage tail length tape measure family protein n=1 Tax=Jiella avicenniae TaxID=2907202 RepID=A0A9X1T556_9HYPH|nr:phage tail length tape measure family protein [Jiella avicenniae]MCE7028479.1 phage tail length tape measure family protein [Jiella avicenniae]
MTFALGLSVDSSGVKSGTSDLDRLTAASAKAEAAALKLGSGVEEAGRRVANGGKNAERMLAAMERIEKAIMAVERTTAPLAGGIGRMEAAMAAASRTTDVMAGANRRLTSDMAAVAPAAAASAASIKAVNDNARLTSNQMLNLSRQGNDVVTMFALGAAPMQIFASQAGQIYDAIAGGQGGLSGGLKALGGSLRSALIAVGPLGLAIGGLATAVGAYAYSIRKDFPDLAKALEAQEKALAAIEKRYGSLSDSVTKLGDRLQPTSIIAGKAIRDLQMLQREQQSALDRQLSAASGIGGAGMAATAAGAAEAGIDLSGERAPTASRFAKIRDTVDAFRNSLNAGSGDILSFYSDLERMYARAGNDKEMQKAIEAARQYGSNLFDITVKLKQLERAQWEANNGVAKFRQTMATFNDAVGGMRSVVPDMRTDAQKIEENYQVAMRTARTEAQVTAATEARTAALNQLALTEDRRRQGVAIDLQAISARTTAEKAAIASQQAFNEALSDPSLDQHARSLRAAEAAMRVYAEATKAANDNLRAASQANTLAGLDGYAATIAEINARYDEQTALYGANTEAAQANERARAFELDTARITNLKAANEQLRQAENAYKSAGLEGYAAGLEKINQDYARQIELSAGNAEAVKRLNAARNLELATLAKTATRDLYRPQQDRLADLEAEARGMTMSADAARRMAEETKALNDLRSAGIDALSEQGQAYLKNARALSDYEEQIRKSADAWGEVQKAGGDAIDKIVDALNGGDIEGVFDEILKEVQSSLLEFGVKNPLKNALTGTNLPTIMDLFADPKAPKLSMPEIQSTPLMNVTASVVNLGGMGLSGIPGLGAANSNVPGAVQRSGALAPVAAMDAASQRVADAWSLTGNQLVDGINQAAQALGIQAKDLATAISYETGGTFDPMKRGPTTQWGQHRGLIQFGEPQARRFGVDFSSPESALSSQLGANGAIVKYLRSTGVRPGMGMMDIYSAINAGGVGRYGASDANNGGAPGTVADKVNYQMAAHAAKAEALLAQSTRVTSALTDASSQIATTAPQFATSLGQQLNGTIVGGAGQIADQFVPGLGGVVQTFLQAFQNAAPGGGAGGIGGWIASAFGGGGSDPWAGLRFADGAAFPGGIAGHSNSIVSRPTVFAFANGAGLMGEAGPEAIMPLSRGPGGRLGVTMAMPDMPRMQAPANSQSQPLNLQQTFVNAPPVKETREESDGRGGRRQTIVFDEMVSKTVKGGPKTGRALGQRGAKPPLVR